MMIVIRAFASHEWETYKELRLRSLAESPDAFGRTLAEEQIRPDPEWEARLRAGVHSDTDHPLVAEANDQPIGLAWGRIDPSTPDVANLYQMWVDPGHRSRGIGGKLVEEIIAWAKAKEVRSLELGVTYRDSPAMRLYARYGFMPVGKPKEFRPGSHLLGLTMRLELHRGSVHRLQPD
jgi:GNAT superfamily N-acetyltransferase